MNTERLHLIYTHLMTGNLSQEFDFSQITSAEYQYEVPHLVAVNECDTLGCAIGEFPQIWPEEFDYKEDKYRVIVKRKTPFDMGAYASFAEWFDISIEAFDHLFEPSSQRTSEFGGEYLLEIATREQVAGNIKAFMEIVLDEESARSTKII